MCEIPIPIERFLIPDLIVRFSMTLDKLFQDGRQFPGIETMTASEIATCEVEYDMRPHLSGVPLLTDCGLVSHIQFRSGRLV